MRDLSADTELKHFSLNTGTLRDHDLPAILEAASRHGISQISPWRHQVAAIGLDRAVKAVRDGGFVLSSYCRGGLFPTDKAHRLEVRDDNRRAVDEAVELGAPCLVIVSGGLPQFTYPEVAPSRDIVDARRQVHDGIAELLDYAETVGMPLALEPLHPMTAASRCCLNTMRQALDICDGLDPERNRQIGIALDVYHVWWDPELYEQIERTGIERLLNFHICDWLEPTTNMLAGRGMMGDGVIEIPRIRAAIEAMGFAGACEVEILSTDWWKRPIDEILSTAIERYRTVC